MRQHYNVIAVAARAFDTVRQTVSAGWAATYLNGLGLRTTAGGMYDPSGRGIYKTLAAAYAALKAAGRQQDADAVAKVFTKPDARTLGHSRALLLTCRDGASAPPLSRLEALVARQREERVAMLSPPAAP